MLTIEKPLDSMTAGDLMSAELVTLPEEMSLQAAARLLSRGQVTGAPVVNSAGRCIGVLTAVDYLHWAEHGGAPERKPCACNDTAWKPWQMLDDPRHSETRVGDLMTRDPVKSSSRTTAGELARMMLDAHIHRVVIVDHDDKPVGIVSSTDILAALAHADAVRETNHAWPN